MNYQGGKGKINYELFTSESSKADETLLKDFSVPSHGVATSWKHCGSLRFVLPFL